MTNQKQPLYHAIAQSLQKQRLDLDTPLSLADEPTLAREYGVARETIRRALQYLEQQGAVTRKRGVGTFLQPLYPQSDGLEGKQVGVVPPPWLSGEPDSRYATMMYQGIGRWSEANDCAFSILPSGKAMDENRWLRLLHQQKLSGIVWIQPQESQLGLVDKTSKLLPTVVVGRHVPGAKLHSIVPDYEKAANLIDRHFVKNGCAPYTLVGKNILDPYTRDWMESFSAAQLKRGERFNHISNLIDYIPFHDRNLGKLLLDFYLPYHPEVKGFFFLSSGYLHWALTDNRFREEFFRDYSVATFDYSHYPLDSFLPGRTITNITCDWEKIAYRGMETLSLIAAGHQVAPVIREEVRLIKGDTVHSSSKKSIT